MSHLSFARLRLSLVIIGLIFAAGAVGLTLQSRSVSSASTSSVAASSELPTLRGEAAVEQLKQQGVYASLNEAVARTRYNLQRSNSKDLPARLKLNGEVWHAANPAQNLNAYFARDGVKVVERSEDKPGWELGLRVTGYGYGKQWRELAPGEMRAEGNRVEYTRPTVSQDSAFRLPPSAFREWYINSSAGVEQGFTIDAAPGEKPAGEALRVRMELAAGWHAELAAKGQAVTLSGQRGEQLHYNKLAVWDANKQPLKAWMEVEGQEVRLAVDDANAVYPVTIDPTLSQQAKLTASDGRADDVLGGSVAISGDTVVIGVSGGDVGANLNQGAVYVFVRSGAAWTLQQKLTADGGKGSDLFGHSVAISGETIVVGAYFADVSTNDRRGAAYIFVRSGTTWTQQQRVTVNDGSGVTRFGWSVAISGETIVVGATIGSVADNLNGSAYVFVRSGTLWTQQQRLIVTSSVPINNFGQSVAISGDTIVVGASFDDIGSNINQGSAHIFVRSGTTWTLQQRLLAPDGTAPDQFGHSVAIDGETLVVGAHLDQVVPGGNEGSAYVFVRSGTAWTLQQKLVATGGSVDDRFGSSVAIEGETIVVGAVFADIDAFVRRGLAYVFVRTGTTWTQQLQLTANDATREDQFGYTVAISRGTVVVGAPGKALGVNEDQGATYVFACLGDGVWSAQAGINGELPSIAAFFGQSVAISGDTAVVGAYLDDLVNNNNQGLAYVFVRRGTTWTRQQILSAADGATSDTFGNSVAVMGDTIVIGASQDDVGANTNQGSAYVFVRNGTTWTQQQQLTAIGGATNDQFGQSVAISGETIVIGANSDDVGPNNNQGSAYVFVRSGGGWTQQQQLTAVDGTLGDNFGQSVAISGDTIVVGVNLDDVGGNNNQGSAYVFVRSGTTWGLQQQLTALGGAAIDHLGFSVAIAGEIIVVGAYLDDVGSNLDQGSAYVFVRNSGAWAQQAQLTASDGARNHSFGNAVAISGETVVVGANQGVVGANLGQGSAYVFERSGTTWSQRQKLIDTGGTQFDQFGYSVAISDETIIVGASGDDITSNENGSAHIFVRNCGVTATGPDLTLTKSDGGATASPGTTIVYNLNYANVGAAQATGVTLSETVPVGTTFNAAASSSGWACTPNGNAGARCTLNLGTVAVGASGQRTFAVTVDGTVAAGINQISNTASIFDDGRNGTDPTLPNTASDATPLNAQPSLRLTKTDNNASVAPGGTITYVLGYSNLGTQGATGVVLTETVPANTTFNAASTAGWSCAGSNCTFNVGALSTGGVGTVNFVVTVNGSLPTNVLQISNTARITDDGANGSAPSTASASDTTQITRQLVANNDSYATTRDTALTIPAPGVLGNDAGNALTAVLVTNPASGTLNLNANGSFTFTPAANFTGTISFTYKANDGAQDSNTATVTINVNAGSNRPPVANNDSYSTNRDTALVVPAPGVLGNDTDPDGNSLTAALASNPASGTVSLNPNGSFTYTPATNFSGSLSFTYRASDGTTNSNVATVTITVNAGSNRPPVANVDSKTTNEDTVITFPASNLTANDTDADNDTLTVTSVGTASNGTVSLVRSNITFTPTANRNSPSTAFSFTYIVSDGKGGTATGTVNITVNPINDAPSFTLAGNPPPSVANAGAQTVAAFARNISAGPADEAGQSLAFRVTVAGTTGGLSFAAAPAINAAGNLTYTAAPNTSGTAIVSVILTDNGSGVAPNVNTSTPRTFTITVGAIVNTPPVARNDSYTTNEDTVLTVPAPGVRANDTDAEGGSLTAALVTAPSSGRLTFSSDGSFIYTPAENFFGTVTFAYRVNDGAANSNPAVVTITVNAVNDAPDAMDDEAISIRNTPVIIKVLANDSTANDTGETLRVTAVTQGMLGAVVINPDRTVTYTPNIDFTGHDMFTYTISDGNGGTDTAMVEVRGSHLLEPTPASVLPGGTITIKWTAPEGSSARDWIGLFRVGDSNRNYDRARRFYTDGAASGSRTITMPRTPGQYEFRYFLDDGFTRVARSIVITVGTPTCPTVGRLSAASGRIRSVIAIRGVGFAGVTAVSFGGARAQFFVINDATIIAAVPASATTGPITLVKAGCAVTQTVTFTIISDYSLRATPASVSPGGNVTVQWTAPARRNARDWIGLFRVGERNNDEVSRFVTDGVANSSRTVAMPTTPGQYEFRYFRNNRARLVRASLPITVIAP